jgi:outer membrane receptor protein involved in Fe transport
LLAVTIAAAFPVHAQQQAPAVTAEPARVEVRGSAAAYDARRDDTASKIVVSHDEIVKYGDTSVADVLKRVPGVTISGSGRNSEVRMRGLGNGYTQILIDGGRAPPNFTIDSLSPEVIERIEVLRVASAEFSTQSIAGTINIVLKKAVKLGQRSAKLGYAHGAATAAPDASVQLSDKRGQLSYSLAASVTRNHSWQQPHTVERQTDAAGNVERLRESDGSTAFRGTFINVTPRLTWTFDGGDTLTSQTFLNINQYHEANTDHITALSGPQPDYPVLDWSQDSTWHIAREEVNWVHKFGDGVKLDTKLSGMVTTITSDTHRSADAPLLRSPLLRYFAPASGDDHGAGTTGKLSSTTHAGHTLAAGWDAERTTRDAESRERDELQPGVPLTPDQRYGIAVSRLALYAQDEWNITPNWSTYVGARWEGILIRTDGNTFATAHSRSKVWSPLFQTLYKLPGTKGDQLRFAVSRTYKAPGLLALMPLRFKSGNNTQTNADYIGNPNLRPELALGFDAGYERHLAQGALLSASVSERRIDDYIRNVLTLDGDRWTSSPVNAGKARTRGLELEAKFPLKALVDTTMALDLRASLSRNWSKVDTVPGPDNRLDAQTPLSATLGADYTGGQLTLGGTFVIKTAGAVRVQQQQVSYQSVKRDLDVYALWQFDPKLQLRIAGSNLLAQQRIAASDFMLGDGDVWSTRTLTPSHRSARATLQMKF